MCVIIIKEKGKNLPSKKTLKACYRRNPDGMGFASQSRSFHSMDFDEFYKKLSCVAIDEPCIIHFRYATKGSVSVKNCHPFKANLDNGRLWFAHNGTIKDIAPVGDKTDSETTFKYYILPYIKEFGFNSTEMNMVVDDVIGTSRFAFLFRGEIVKYGQFFNYEGCQFSNLRWMNTVVPVSVGKKKITSKKMTPKITYQNSCFHSQLFGDIPF